MIERLGSGCVAQRAGFSFRLWAGLVIPVCLFLQTATARAMDPVEPSETDDLIGLQLYRDMMYGLDDYFGENSDLAYADGVTPSEPKKIEEVVPTSTSPRRSSPTSPSPGVSPGTTPGPGTGVDQPPDDKPPPEDGPPEGSPEGP
jgi:hypothetical protein